MRNIDERCERERVREGERKMKPLLNNVFTASLTFLQVDLSSCA